MDILVLNYPMSLRADCGTTLAWASMEAEACTRMLALAKRVLSSAMSTSMMRPLAASRFAIERPECSKAKLRREAVPPF